MTLDRIAEAADTVILDLRRMWGAANDGSAQETALAVAIEGWDRFLYELRTQPENPPTPAPDPVGPLAELRDIHRRAHHTNGPADYCTGCGGPWPCLATRLADAHEQALRLPLTLAQQIQDRDELLSRWEGVRDRLEAAATRWENGHPTPAAALGAAQLRAILTGAPRPDDDPDDLDPEGHAT